MTVLYFSSTGNCLYVAKRIGGNILSIPKCIRDNIIEIEDEAVGIVFPVYGLCVPPYIKEFIENITIQTHYLFGIATYGCFPGAVCSQLSGITTKNGRSFDYIQRLKMGENCVTFSDMANSKGDSDRQQKDMELIIEDIIAHKAFIRGDSPFKKLLTKDHMKNYEFETGVGITDKLTITSACAGCGTCVKMCPMGNISMKAGKPAFGNNCISCGACIQNCFTGAIHHENEKSAARYRNPHIKPEELLCS